MHLSSYLSKQQAKELIIEFVCTTLLTLTLLFLCNMMNSPYQTLKNIYAAKAFCAFAAYLLFLQRPRILNYQTALVTALYLPIALAYRARFHEHADLFNRDKVVVWIVYFLLLILTDMYVNKKVNPFQNMNKPLLFIYGFMTISMIFYRNNSTMPIILFMIFVVYLIPLTASNWNRIFQQVGNAWIISFIIVLIQSLRLNPSVAENGRWYGCFINIGDFGLFLSCVFIILVFRLYRSKKRTGFVSFGFIIHALLFLCLLWVILRVSTITMFIGILFSAIMFFILFTKNGTYKETLFRLSVAVTAIVVVLCLGLICLKAIATNADKEYWQQMLYEGNVLIKPLANIITRAFYMFEEPITFADSGIFPPYSVINYLDLFASGRISIIKLFAEQFTFTGSPSDGIQVGTYYAYNAHNTYVQSITEYGYIAGGAHIVWLLACTITSVRHFINTKKSSNLFLCLWMAMTLGVLTGECARLYTPVIFFTLFLTYPLIVNIPSKKKPVTKH